MYHILHKKSTIVKCPDQYNVTFSRGTTLIFPFQGFQSLYAVNHLPMLGEELGHHCKRLVDWGFAYLILVMLFIVQSCFIKRAWCSLCEGVLASYILSDVHLVKHHDRHWIHLSALLSGFGCDSKSQWYIGH